MLDVDSSLLTFLIIIELIIMIMKENVSLNRSEICDISVLRSFSFKRLKVSRVQKL